MSCRAFPHDQVSNRMIKNIDEYAFWLPLVCQKDVSIGRRLRHGDHASREIVPAAGGRRCHG